MKLILAVLIICGIVNCKENATVNIRVLRFVGGRNAELKQFPYMASLRSSENGRHFCGGSIIDEQFILTAAHCVVNHDRKKIYVAVGTTSVNNSRKRYFVERFSTHVHYNATRLTDDIALIKLKKSIKFSSFIQKIPLDISEPPVGVTMMISGWGLKTEKGNMSSTLQYSKLTSLVLRICRHETREHRKKFVITKRHMCTRNIPGKGFCNGDSGGPLVYNGKQVGIVSWSINCGYGFPDVYIKVSSYINWIEFTKNKLNRLALGT